MLKRFELASALAALLALTAAGETVEIRSAADWDNFAKRVNDGERALDAILIRDVTLASTSPRCGTSTTRYYAGDFNGNGKTLTVAWKIPYENGKNLAAPFPCVGGANIHDLQIAGSIESDGKFAAGITTWIVTGKTTLNRCRVSATINCTLSGDTSSGGFIGNVASGSVDILNCLFDGSLTGTGAINSGGFVGWRNQNYAYAVYVKNCLFAPKSVTWSSSGSYTLVRPNFRYAADNVNNYYLTAYGTTQGTSLASSTSAADKVAKLGSDWEVVNDVALPKFVVTSFAEAGRGLDSFTYQGVLRDAQGNALSKKSHTITFRIYDQATGGAPFWGRKVPVTLDNDGLFSVQLGDFYAENVQPGETDYSLGDGTPSSGLSEVIAKNSASTLYIGLKVDSDESEIMPRQKLLAVPCATYVADALTSSSSFAVTGKVSAARMVLSSALAAKSVTVQSRLSSRTVVTTGDATINGNLTVSSTVDAEGVVPIGGIIPWGGAINAIPEGWALCNGQTSNGCRTPDLRDRFIVGSGKSYSIGNTGGANTVKLTLNQMPSHNHSFSFKGADLDLSWKDANNFYCTWGKYDNNNTAYTDYKGGDQAHENRPPYYALCYIMRVK